MASTETWHRVAMSSCPGQHGDISLYVAVQTQYQYVVIVLQLANTNLSISVASDAIELTKMFTCPKCVVKTSFLQSPFKYHPCTYERAGVAQSV